MQVILTHEQADFDAIASLLGAALLQNNSTAILPQVLNRNVKNFIHLYSVDLPFISHANFNKSPIETITLVDTQSLITLKGTHKSTRIFVIDHHAPKEDLPNNWEFKSVSTGACTTYFVENLQEKNGNLSLIQATLLLLGIYEDTGSLTYANTTSRDAYAVAYLLEQGASLKIAAEFLNPPLSDSQRKVFQKLLSTAETVTVHDCRILISTVKALDLDDEVSTIAHKISDLSDPDGLFIFVETKEGIRLVARSFTDQINAGIIARQFGGGGHERAAAALIKRNMRNECQLTEIVAKFKYDLPGLVKPAISVRQIMSKKPLTISPDTTAEQALTLMKNYGYEGYPVIDNGKIIGLLTRRSVDRALSHKLNLPASSLMEAGNIFVFPGDSLETLQMVMADAGWGQVPVVDSKSNQVIGIVTRTDLLKTIAGHKQGIPKIISLADTMENDLPAGSLAFLKLISLAAGNLRLPIYLVGGFARDLILGAPGLDMDFVVEGDAIQLAKTLSDKYGGRFTYHKKFGTAKWHLPVIKNDIKNKKEIDSLMDFSSLPPTIDLISARTEFYDKPTALPTVKSGSIKLDLHRRDFTINTMAVRLDGYHFGDLYDYWGGLADLKKGLIRVMHSLSFVDDPTRMLRAIRFEQRFGFEIEERTLELFLEARKVVADVSGDRIRHELDLILKEPNAPRMLARINKLKLLPDIFKYIKWDSEKEVILNHYYQENLPKEWFTETQISNALIKVQGTYILLTAQADPVDTLKVLRRLRIKNHLAQMVIRVNSLWHQLLTLKGLKPSQVSQRLHDFSQIEIFSLYILCSDNQIRSKLENYALKWRNIKSSTNGLTLKKMGLKPGPLFNEILTQLKAARIDGEINSDLEEKAYLKKLLETQSQQNNK